MDETSSPVHTEHEVSSMTNETFIIAGHNTDSAQATQSAAPKSFSFSSPTNKTRAIATVPMNQAEKRMIDILMPQIFRGSAGGSVDEGTGSSKRHLTSFDSARHVWEKAIDNAWSAQMSRSGAPATQKAARQQVKEDDWARNSMVIGNIASLMNDPGLHCIYHRPLDSTMFTPEIGHSLRMSPVVQQSEAKKGTLSAGSASGVGSSTNRRKAYSKDFARSVHKVLKNKPGLLRADGTKTRYERMFPGISGSLPVQNAAAADFRWNFAAMQAKYEPSRLTKPDASPQQVKIHMVSPRGTPKMDGLSRKILKKTALLDLKGGLNTKSPSSYSLAGTHQHGMDALTGSSRSEGGVVHALGASKTSEGLMASEPAHSTNISSISQKLVVLDPMNVLKGAGRSVEKNQLGDSTTEDFSTTSQSSHITSLRSSKGSKGQTHEATRSQYEGSPCLDECFQCGSSMIRVQISTCEPSPEPEEATPEEEPEPVCPPCPSCPPPCPPTECHPPPCCPPSCPPPRCPPPPSCPPPPCPPPSCPPQPACPPPPCCPSPPCCPPPPVCPPPAPCCPPPPVCPPPPPCPHPCCPCIQDCPPRVTSSCISLDNPKGSLKAGGSNHQLSAAVVNISPPSATTDSSSSTLTSSDATSSTSRERSGGKDTSSKGKNKKKGSSSKKRSLLDMAHAKIFGSQEKTPESKKESFATMYMSDMTPNRRSSKDSIVGILRGGTPTDSSKGKTFAVVTLMSEEELDKEVKHREKKEKKHRKSTTSKKSSRRASSNMDLLPKMFKEIEEPPAAIPAESEIKVINEEYFQQQEEALADPFVNHQLADVSTTHPSTSFAVKPEEKSKKKKSSRSSISGNFDPKRLSRHSLSAASNNNAEQRKSVQLEPVVNISKAATTPALESVEQQEIVKDLTEEPQHALNVQWPTARNSIKVRAASDVNETDIIAYLATATGATDQQPLLARKSRKSSDPSKRRTKRHSSKKKQYVALVPLSPDSAARLQPRASVQRIRDIINKIPKI